MRNHVVFTSVLCIRIRIVFVTWIRIRSASASDKKPDPDPHQSDKLDPDPHLFTDDKPKCMEYETILALFLNGLGLYL
jgi:hypothetical protein